MNTTKTTVTLQNSRPASPPSVDHNRNENMTAAAAAVAAAATTKFIGTLPINIYENSPKKYQANPMNFINLKQMNDEMKATDWSFFHQKSLLKTTSVSTTATTVAEETVVSSSSTTTTTTTAAAVTASPETVDSYKLTTSRKIFDDFFQNSLFLNSSDANDETSGLSNGIVKSISVTDENQKKTIDVNETIIQQPLTGVNLLHNYIGRRLACASNSTASINDGLSTAECTTNANVLSSVVPALLDNENNFSNSVRQKNESQTRSLPIVSATTFASTLVSLPPPQPFVASSFDNHDNKPITSVTTTTLTTTTTTSTSTCRKTTPISNKFIDLFELGDYFDMKNLNNNSCVQPKFPFTTPSETETAAVMMESTTATTSSIFHENENKIKTTEDVDNRAAFLFNNLFETTGTNEVEVTSSSDAVSAINAASDFVAIAATPFDDFDNDNDNDKNSDLIKCFSSQSLINLVTSREDSNDDDGCFTNNGPLLIEDSHAFSSVTGCASGGDCSGLITPPSPAPPHAFSLSSFLDDFSLVDTAASTEPSTNCVSSRGCDTGNDNKIAITTTTSTTNTCDTTTTTITMPATNNPFFLHSNSHIMSSHQVSNVIKDICFTLKNTKKIDNDEPTVAAPIAKEAIVTVHSSTLPTSTMTSTKPIPPPRLTNGDLKSPIWVPRYSTRDNTIGDIDNSAAIVHENGNDYDNENQSDNEDVDTNENIEHNDNGNNTNGNDCIVNSVADNLSITGDDSDNVHANDGHSNQCDDDIDTDLETDRLLGEQRSEQKKLQEKKQNVKNKTKNVFEAAVLEKGVSFVALYLGSTQIPCKGQPTKSTRMLQAEEAVSRIKALAPEGENQPNTEVDLFISTKKIMVLNKKGAATSGPLLKEMQNTQSDRKNNLIMEHDLRTISYIADIGKLVVLMARRKITPHEIEDTSSTTMTTMTTTATTTSTPTVAAMMSTTTSTAGVTTRTPKMICHIFESKEGFTNEKAQRVAQTIGQSFQLAYMSFLQENGIEDNSFVKEMDYQEVLNSQEIFGNELNMFAKKELQKEVIVPKAKNEILGVVIVESGWGSMLPTVVIANLAPLGPAFRCSQLNIGDQIIAINGISLVGLPLSTCQTYIKQTRHQSVVKLTVVPCAPVVEVKIKRPDTKYQLGFSVQNGVICSLLRGGIAERGGVRVGHRIIEINNQSVVAVPHEKIVNILATSVGEILMKTMPTSMFRLLTGQENPIYI